MKGVEKGKQSSEKPGAAAVAKKKRSKKSSGAPVTDAENPNPSRTAPPVSNEEKDGTKDQPSEPASDTQSVKSLSPSRKTLPSVKSVKESPPPPLPKKKKRASRNSKTASSRKNPSKKQKEKRNNKIQQRNSQRLSDLPDEAPIDPPLPGEFYPERRRVRWDNNIDFLLSLIGFAVDASNIWGFPAKCLLYGGGSFIIPYAIILTFCVIPVLYMELIIGQFVQQGQISVFKICPLFKGVGWTSVIISFLVSFFYNVQLAWALVYMYESVGYSEVRWLKCDNFWNWHKCSSVNVDDDTGENETEFELEDDASRQFFRRHVLKLDGENVNYDMDNLGPPDVGLAFALMFVYAILFVWLLFGIRVTGKVVWVTATTPYIVLGLLLFRGVTLPGSVIGLAAFISPKFEVLLARDVWIAAALQVFFSAGAGFGPHLTYSSFNSFRHPLLRDAIVTMIMNSATSVLCGLVIFSYLGNVAYSTRRSIEAVVEDASGPALVFEIFPTAVGRLPGAKFFCLASFMMLFMIGIDSSLGALQSITTAFTDEFSRFFGMQPKLRTTFIFGCCSISYLFSLFCVTHGGIYVHSILEFSAAGVSLMVSVFLFTIGIGYVFGMKELCDACEAMTGRRPGIFFNICWKFVTPGILLAIIVVGVIGAIYDVPQFEGVQVPWWGYIIGLVLNFLPILAFPVTALCVLCATRADSCAKKFKLTITPYHERKKVKSTGVSRRTTLKHLFYFEASCRSGRPPTINIPAKVAPAPTPAAVPVAASKTSLATLNKAENPDLTQAQPPTSPSSAQVPAADSPVGQPEAVPPPPPTTT